MANIWERHNRQNPCPVCDEAKKGCRTNKENNITHCRGDSPSNAYQFLGQDKWGFGMFKLEAEIEKEKEAEKEEWLEEKRREHRRRDRERSEQLKQQLSVEDRDQAIRRVLSQLNLNATDREKLKTRGLTDDQINQAQYRSVKKWQKLDGVTAALAGINRRGNLNNPWDGILIPIPNEDGLWVGMRLHDPDNKETGNTKYIWLSSPKSGKTPHYRNGENPIGVYYPSEYEHYNRIGLCEGLEWKPKMAAERLGYPVIGFSGSNFDSSPKTLKATLSRLEEKIGSDNPELTFIADGGIAVNPHVMGGYRSTAKLLDGWGYTTSILDWGQLDEKGDNDIDEISSEVLESAIAIPASDFLKSEEDDFSKGEEWEEPPQDEYKAYQEQLEQEEKIEEAQRERDREQWREQFYIADKNSWRRLKQFTPDIRINKRFLSPDDFPQQEGLIVAIKSGLGSGKSSAMGDVIKALPDDEGCIALGSRNNLLIQTSNKWGFDHLKTLESQGIGIYHYISDTTSRIACCFDSVIKFNPQDFDSRNIILDETTAGVLHLLTSETDVSRHLQEICDLFEEALKRAKRIFCLDGMLNDSTIAYLHKLAPDKSVIKIQNDFETPMELHHYEGTREIRENEPYLKKRDRAPLVDLMAWSECPFVVSDSQLFCAATEKLLTQELGPNGIRIDRTTAAEEHVKAFMRDPDSYIRENNLQWVIGSPSMENGVDVSIRDYFSDCFFFGFGALKTDAMHEILFRLRDPNVARWFWVNEFDTKNEQLRSPFFKQNLKNHEQFLLLDLQNAFESGQDVIELFREFCQMRQENPHSDMWSKLVAIYDHERRKLRECLIESLESKGHKITTFSEWDEVQLKREKEAKDEVKNEYSKAIFYAEDIDKKEIEDRKKRGKFEDQCAVTKKLIKIKLPGIEKTQIWNEELIRLFEFDDRNRIKHLQRFWLLNNLEEAQRLQQKRWEKVQDGIVSRYHFRSDFLKIKVLIDAGIETFLTQDDKEWKSDDEEVQAFFKNCKKWEFKLAFGKAPGRKSQPMQWLNTCLSFFGYKTRKRKKRIEGTAINIYTIIPLLKTDQINPTLFECIKSYFTEILEKDKEATAQAKSEETAKSTQPHSEQEVKGDPPLSVFYKQNSKGGSVPEYGEEEGGSPLAKTTQPHSVSEPQADPPLSVCYKQNSKGGSVPEYGEEKGGSPLAESPQAEENTDSSSSASQCSAKPTTQVVSFPDRDRAASPPQQTMPTNGGNSYEQGDQKLANGDQPSTNFSHGSQPAKSESSDRAFNTQPQPLPLEGYEMGEKVFHRTPFGKWLIGYVAEIKAGEEGKINSLTISLIRASPGGLEIHDPCNLAKIEEGVA